MFIHIYTEKKFTLHPYKIDMYIIAHQSFPCKLRLEQLHLLPLMYIYELNI